MNCAEFHEQVGALALDAVEPEERRALEAHLAEGIAHEGCREAMLAAQRAAGRLSAGLSAQQPDPALWPRIEAKVRPRGSVGLGRRERLGWALLVAASLAFVVFAYRRHREDRSLVAALTSVALRARADRAACAQALEAAQGPAQLRTEVLALLEKPGTRVMAMKPAGKGVTASATAVIGEGAAYIVSSSLPERPGKDYELWVIRGSAAPVPAGLVQQGKGGAIGKLDPRLLAAGPPSAIALSLEPTGGSATPTEVLLVGALAG